MLFVIFPQFTHLESRKTVSTISPTRYLPQCHTKIENLRVTGNQTYDEMAQRKQKVYTASNYHFIGLRPTDMTKDYQTHIVKAIDNHLYGRLKQYRQTTSSYRHK